MKKNKKTQRLSLHILQNNTITTTTTKNKSFKRSIIIHHTFCVIFSVKSSFNIDCAFFEFEPIAVACHSA